MNCPECGVEVNEQVSRCYSCGALLIKKEEPADTLDGIGKRTKRSLPFLLLLGYFLLLVVITFPLYAVVSNRQKAERLRDHLEKLMEGLENYADDHGQFPDDINQLIHEGIITSFPGNPYHNRMMKPRPVGQPFSGDFTYIPIYDETGRALACVLVGYGPDLNKGQDVFTEGNIYSRMMEFRPEPDGIPDGVIVILHSKRGPYQA